MVPSETNYDRMIGHLRKGTAHLEEHRRGMVEAMAAHAAAHPEAPVTPPIESEA